jgi:hypothetical protein
MDADRLFLERCKQVKLRMQSNREIDLLDLSAHLRQLLLDSPRLIDEVNRAHRIKLTFSVGDFALQPDAYTAFLSLEDGVDPDTRARPGAARKQVNLDGLLGHKILHIKGRAHSVRDVIVLAANMSGGVHRTPKPDERFKLMVAYAHSVSQGGLPGALRQLQSIARVTLKGLAPLVDAVEKGNRR